MNVTAKALRYAMCVDTDWKGKAY